MKNLWLWLFLCLFACQSVASFIEVGLTDGEVSQHDTLHHQNESQSENLHDDEHHVHMCHHHHGEHNPPVLLSSIKWVCHIDTLSANKHAPRVLPHRFITPLLRPPITA